MRLLLIAPGYDRTDVGEVWSAYKWVQGISPRHETTILTMHRREWDARSSPVEADEIVNWTEYWCPPALRRFRNELKPWYIRFHYLARAWMRKALKQGREFDLVHQINPLAIRYPCPARGLGIPTIIGPLGGSLKTPPAFDDGSVYRGAWFRRFRGLDEWRMRHDRSLRESYATASLILGVTPSTEEFISLAGCRRFEVMGETGVDAVRSNPRPKTSPDHPLRLLFVGRIIRTKGVIDAIRAVGIVAENQRVRFDVIGGGEMIEECRREVESLGLGDVVKLHGKVPRSEVDEWYERSDVFLFPSFREPSGNVVFEAMGRGLPVITSTKGGPGFMVTDECGILVEPQDPGQFAEGLAAAIQALHEDRDLLFRKSAAALERMRDVAVWDRKIERLDGLYREVVQSEA